MELIVFLICVGIIALIGIVWNLIGMHNDSVGTL